MSADGTKTLANLRTNREFAGLSASAEARAVGDQLYGYNLTRAYTLAARKVGYQGVLSVGWVQTPILGLVVRRDREFEAHVKSFYYYVTGQFPIQGLHFPARYRVRVAISRVAVGHGAALVQDGPHFVDGIGVVARYAANARVARVAIALGRRMVHNRSGVELGVATDQASRVAPVSRLVRAISRAIRGVRVFLLGCLYPFDPHGAESSIRREQQEDC